MPPPCRGTGLAGGYIAIERQRQSDDRRWQWELPTQLLRRASFSGAGGEALRAPAPDRSRGYWGFARRAFSLSPDLECLLRHARPRTTSLALARDPRSEG
jgi:hypothetical protein